MHEYSSINKTYDKNKRLPSEAMVLDGTTIEEQINGYQTLAVTGRELMAKEVMTEAHTLSDGAIYLGNRYPSREITIKYQLIAESNDEFRKQYEKLNKLLYKSNQEIRFLDDLNNSFYGTLNNSDDVPEGKNAVTSTFSFLCVDPFKYADARVFKGNNILIEFDNVFEVAPEKIIVIPSGATDVVTVKMGSKQLRLTDRNYPANERIVFDLWNEEVYPEKNKDIDYMDKLDLVSDLEYFYLENNEPIILVEKGSLEVHFREAIL